MQVNLLKWGNMKNMIERINSINHLDLRNLKYFLCYGMSGILARYMLWIYEVFFLMCSIYMVPAPCNKGGQGENEGW